MTSPIHNYSEIGKLKTVLLKRPGREVENFTPEMMPRLLFDDIPYLPMAQKEHDYFAETLRDNGVETLYLEKLSAEALDAGGSELRDHFLEQMLAESGYPYGATHDALKEYLDSMSNQDMIIKIMAGVRKNEIDFHPSDLVSAAETEDYPFYLDPMPNLYFTRDPSACIGEGISINHMTFPARQRESLFNEMIINYHPRFANKGIHVWRDRNHNTRIEGGDELVLNDHVMAIGVSERTSAHAIQDIARSLFKNSQYDTVLAVSIPHNHAMMHLDTVFTMVNYDQFTVHPGILGEGGKIDTWTITPGKGESGLQLQHRTDLKAVLKDVLNLDDIDLIPTGGGDPIIADREQWNDGSNTLTIAPGVVVTYNRNYVSNELLRKHGLKVLEVISSELSRGRGGPRCMSCPIVREDL
ncbi:MAG: arginine deiminase [Lentilactobacillus diolivorans]|mgnify:FL=1|jgi:arginine deiminase|uniref:arginine deiminase n=1 Tax=Lentilactobacillus diolivorans TaxID=179838 RepID=UPI000FF34416|nr:arginine deiminase [Lentilactobacillus diolivorans]MCH4163686.1 arginine deiminase [Lentilactobacillus diolivorans]MDH5106752.1 arginine deiminase [Lentilactobacillus diolivorans]RRG03579.1 MAG: arginine deiminase [Lactobacillus sp.]